MAHPGPGQGPRQPFGAVHRGCFAHAVSSALTMPMRFSPSLCVRDQATTRLVEVLTRISSCPLVFSTTIAATIRSKCPLRWRAVEPSEGCAALISYVTCHRVEQ